MHLVGCTVRIFVIDINPLTPMTTIVVVRRQRVKYGEPTFLVHILILSAIYLVIIIKLVFTALPTHFASLALQTSIMLIITKELIIIQ